MATDKDKTTLFQLTSNATQATSIDGTEAVVIEQQGLKKVTLLSTIISYINNGIGDLTKALADTYYTPIVDDIKHIDFVVSSAAFQTIHSVPISLLPLAGAAFEYDIISCIIDYNYLTSAYTITDTIVLAYDNGGVNAILTFASADFSGSASGTILRNSLGAGIVASAANQGLWLYSASNPTAGLGSFKVRVAYRIVTV